MADKTSVLIVDDHPLFREGLKTIISRDPGYEVTGEAGNGREALRLAEELSPDLVIMDVSLPDLSGIDLTRQIRELVPKARVLIVSLHAKAEYIAEAFQAGATGYVVKESAAARLLQGLEAVARGEYFLDGLVARQVVEMLMEGPAKADKLTNAAYQTLTPREQEILVLLAEGLSAKEVGEKLFISAKTVENHRAKIMGKLGLHTTIDLMRYALKYGLIQADSWKE